MGELTDKDLRDFSDQKRAIWQLMQDGQWHSVEEIERAASGARECLRRLREFRAKGFIVEKRRSSEDSRNFLYRLRKVPTQPAGPIQLGMALSGLSTGVRYRREDEFRK